MSRHERFEPEPDPTWDHVWIIIGEGMAPPDDLAKNEAVQ